jgi:outer membrane receptor protein involved in Fe transport
MSGSGTVRITLLTEGISRIRKDKFFGIFTASYNRTDGHRDDLEFEQYGGSAKVGYDFSDTWKAFADVNVTHFNASNPGTVTSPVFDNDSRITRGVTSFSIENNYNKTSGAFKFFYNWGRHKINDGYREGQQPREYEFNSEDVMAGITWYQSATLFKGNRVTVGVDYQHIGGDAWNQFPESRTDIADNTENEVAGYVSLRQTIAGRLTLDMGIRVDHHSQTGTEWVPQGGLALQLPHWGELRAMVSKGFRNPTIRELYMFGSKNPDLLPEKLVSYEISYSQHLLNNAFTYGVNVFYIDGDNIIQTVRINGQQKNVNTGTIKNKGLEVNGSYRINSVWKVFANYSLLDKKYPVIAAPEHKLYAGGSFSKGRWNVSTGLQYINGLYTSVDPEIKENFLLWNLSGGCRLYRSISAFVRGENLLAQRYEINAGYPMPKATVIAGINLDF